MIIIYLILLAVIGSCIKTGDTEALKYIGIIVIVIYIIFIIGSSF